MFYIFQLEAKNAYGDLFESQIVSEDGVNDEEIPFLAKKNSTGNSYDVIIHLQRDDEEVSVIHY